jgi:hypothetical protein
MKDREITISGEAADAITVDNLSNYRDYLKYELTEWNKSPKSDANPNGFWLHPEDVVINMRMIEAMDLILKYFGK